MMSIETARVLTAGFPPAFEYKVPSILKVKGPATSVGIVTMFPPGVGGADNVPAEGSVISNPDILQLETKYVEKSIMDVDPAVDSLGNEIKESDGGDAIKSILLEP